MLGLSNSKKTQLNLFIDPIQVFISRKYLLQSNNFTTSADIYL